MIKKVYLDAMSTTPIDKRVSDKIIAFLKQKKFGNPSSYHHLYGQEAFHIVEVARHKIAAALNAQTDKDIIFTSGATESNNIAIQGAAQFYSRQGKHIITTTIEHHSVLNVFRALEKYGFDVTYIRPDTKGIINIKDIAKEIRTDTILVSIMHINNEIGVIQQIEEIGKYLNNKGIIFHVDAAQSIGKVKIDLSRLNADLVSFSSHKCYGPKGIGALYVRSNPKIFLSPIIYGGDQEMGIRSGTLPTHQIIAIAEAINISQKEVDKDLEHAIFLREVILKECEKFPNFVINSDKTFCTPFCINLSFPGIDAGTLMKSLPDIAISTGSACTSLSSEPSHVLRALQINPTKIVSTLRISTNRFTSISELKYAIKAIVENALKLLK